MTTDEIRHVTMQAMVLNDQAIAMLEDGTEPTSEQCLTCCSSLGRALRHIMGLCEMIDELEGNHGAP